MTLVIAVSVVALAAIHAVGSWRGRRSDDNWVFAVLLIAALVSYAVTASFISNLFLRNGTALGLLFVMGSLLLSARVGVRWSRLAWMAVLVANLAAGLYRFERFAFESGGFASDASFIEVSPVPITARTWSRMARLLETVDCRGYVEVPCGPFDPAFARAGIARRIVEHASGRCIIGSKPLPGDSGSALYVRTKYAEEGQLCFP